MRTGTRGFTLIEMMVVLGVFALLGVIASQVVSGVIDNQAIINDRGSRLAEVQRAMQILQRDVVQMRARSIRDELGDPIAALLIDSSINSERLIEFTRQGWRNPLRQKRSELQRVAYLMREETLYRAYWSVLDRAPDSEPQLQQLLSDVDRLEFFALDVSGNEHSFWPLIGDLAGDPNTQVAAIIMRIELKPFGIVERIWPVPSV